MRKNECMLSVTLSTVVGIIMLGSMLLKTFQPAVVLPCLNIPNIIIASVIALVIRQYLQPECSYNWMAAGALAGLIFGLLPFIAGVAEVERVWKLVLAGGLFFTATERIFHSAMDRMCSGPAGKLAPLSVGLVLILAGQIFAGVFL